MTSRSKTRYNSIVRHDIANDNHSGREIPDYEAGVPRAASLPIMICAEIYQNVTHIRCFLSYNVRFHPYRSLLKLDGFRGSY